MRVIGEGCLGGMRTLGLDMWGTLADKGWGYESLVICVRLFPLLESAWNRCCT